MTAAAINSSTDAGVLSVFNSHGPTPPEGVMSKSASVGILKRLVHINEHLFPKKLPPAKSQVSSPSGFGDFVMSESVKQMRVVRIVSRGADKRDDCQPPVFCLLLVVACSVIFSRDTFGRLFLKTREITPSFSLQLEDT
ncbi:hypothetical protein AVEN_3562-1 [Araneus ventricosus]|uniref:Uncharacterized protein n=1 Tax=Araneus ventricosus TaxID=182803 RepID=A0A4Y2SEC3_ARAVE|nr:hypothetical protein AVEN_3562-1 [Araneus ventricosus]